MPSNTRQRVFSNGTLLIKSVEGTSDSGQYTCVVSNTQGQSAQSSLGLDIMSKQPQIWFIVRDYIKFMIFIVYK